MLYFIYPIDETTEFLLEIPNIIRENTSPEIVKIKIIEPNIDSYKMVFEYINEIPENSIVIFMGHGQGDTLWGAESDTFVKKPFIKKSDSKIFANKNIILLSCNSEEFLKGTFSFSKAINSIGFGDLPTDLSETVSKNKYKELGVNEAVITSFKKVLVEIVSLSLCDTIKLKIDFINLPNLFQLRINKKISEIILEEPHNKESQALGDLLFYLKNEMLFI